MRRLSTPRLALTPATFESLSAELVGPDALAAILLATVPDDWPPPLYDRDAVRFALEQIRDGAMDDSWCFYYVVLVFADGSRSVIGTGGFKGRPNPAGEVEVGYSILPGFQRRGFATEALQAWSDFAFTDPAVSVIIAHTLRGMAASIRVAERAGFTFVGPGADANAPDGHEVLRYERRRPSAAVLSG